MSGAGSLRCAGILFDLDGVLLDSNPLAERHWKAWAERHGADFEHIRRTHFGRPAIDLIRETAPHLDAARALADKSARERGDDAELRAFDGAERLLRSLPPERWAIATSGTQPVAGERLRRFGLPLPKVFVTADDVARGKPAPDPYLQAAAGLGLAADQCLVVEDAPAGIASARAAGARVLAVASSHAPAALADADVVVPALAEVQMRADGSAIEVRWAHRAC